MLDLSMFNNSVFKDSIDTANMDSNSRYYQLWSLWKEYIDYFVAGNDHLKRVGFVNLLGVILTHKGYGFEKAEQMVSTRIHAFLFQRPRSGKGEMMKAKQRLVDYLKIPSRYTMKDNVPSAIGTAKLPESAKEAKEVMKRFGYFSFIYDYNWDEGSILIKSSKDMDNVTDVFQGVMDEPGFVSKGLVWGSVEYETNTSICAGSYIFDEVQSALMNTGFFQRMIITYKVFSDEEKTIMRRLVPLLKIRYNKGRIDKIMKLFKELCNEIPKPKDNMVLFDENSVRRFNNRYDLIYDIIIKNQFVGRTQDILESFSDMIHLMVDKMSAQHAIIDGDDKVYYDNMLITLPIIRIHLSSILSLFETVDNRQVTVRMKREITVLGIIRRYPNISNQKFILKRLDIEKKNGRWDMGRNKTIDLLQSMVSEGKLLVETTTCSNGKSIRLLVIPK